MIAQKIVAAILPVLLCLTTSGCTSREEARQAAAQRFDTYQTAMSEALRPYLFVLQDETSPDDNYESSNYYVRNYTVTLDDDTDISKNSWHRESVTSALPVACTKAENTGV